ncbi:MAG: RNA polymerase sigma factor RpoD/SigA [Treponema sp.]|jgi:RNA polymerase primary sigma factor|nr:RNA polymerase sigma factor RpoD/SigA [Treponema sp.]
MGQKKTQDTDDLLLIYYNQIKSYPLISFEEEKELSRRIQGGDEQAKRRLIEANLRLVVKIARSYITTGVPLLDLIQEGNLGLIHSADKFDYSKQVHFATYANWWIRQSIIRFLANKRRLIRLPNRKEELLLKIQKFYHSLSQRLAREPGPEDLSKELGVPVYEINALLRISAAAVSLDTGNAESGSFIEFYEDYTYNPEQQLIKKSAGDAALNVLKKLKKRERNILMYRYQLMGKKRYTLKKIGDKMGISPETVRQIEMRALRKMRSKTDELQAYLV